MVYRRLPFRFICIEQVTSTVTVPLFDPPNMTLWYDMTLLESAMPRFKGGNFWLCKVNYCSAGAFPSPQNFEFMVSCTDWELRAECTEWNAVQSIKATHSTCGDNAQTLLTLLLTLPDRSARIFIWGRRSKRALFISFLVASESTYQ